MWGGKRQVSVQWEEGYCQISLKRYFPTIPLAIENLFSEWCVCACARAHVLKATAITIFINTSESLFYF